MLELKNIKKYYNVGGTTTKALDDVSVSFRRQEFVAILGASGSGKTTLLNVIGGLDNYDSGDMIIDGKSTKDFKDSDWDAYRNNSIGFVFQSYNLISHLGIIENVELGMTLSGVSKEEKRKHATAALERVGLADHMHKKPNQLSGGQMQRVAIARALANDPDILLCDEPTGALDTETSLQIMKLIKELSKEKLVIMVTHNPELAYDYADRIIEFSDGKIKNDSKPHTEESHENEFKLKRTKMSFFTALKLSFNNLRTKKGRTLLTAFASSIGIISIGIVLSLSNGFQIQIDKTQTETLSKFPITISQVTTDQSMNQRNALGSDQAKYSKKKEVTPKLSEQDKSQHINKINQEYVDYIKDINPNLTNSIGYSRTVAMNMLGDVDGDIKPISFSNTAPNSNNSMEATMSSMTGIGISSFPTKLNKDSKDFLQENYNVIAGDYPRSATDVVLIVDKQNSTNINALKNIGLDVKEDDPIPFDDIVGKEFKLISNNDFYQKIPTGNYIPNTDYEKMYDSNNNTTIRVSGILRIKPSSSMNLLSPGFAYSNDLTAKIVEENEQSDIVKAQRDSNKNIMTNEILDDQAKENLLAYLGGTTTPSSILIYPNNFSDKQDILTYLDKYNKGKDKADRVLYTDLAGTMTQLTGGLMDAITYVLIAFAGISLVTSMIMIGIITYTSVLERTKEIGVLKALGARKKDITRVFDAETCILGIASGSLGVLIAYASTFPINNLLYKLTDLKNVAQLNPKHAIILVIISTVLTMIGGHIPARIAAKKDAAIALRAD